MTVFMFYVSSLLVLLPLVRGSCSRQGTTPQIRDLVEGRCLDFVTNISPDTFCVEQSPVNCTEIAEHFVSAFAFQPTCNVSFNRYDSFIQAAQSHVPRDRGMFWSDVYGYVQRYADRGQRATVLENTLIGYMADGLRFCAQEENPGIAFNKSCAGFDDTKDCPYNAEFSFWAMASKNFASSVSGEVHVMLNASIEDPFYSTSFFATWEVPNMNSSKVSKMMIWMVHLPGQEVKSNCNSASIATLKKTLRDRNIDSACDDSPRGPQAFFCVDYPDVEECKPEQSTGGSSGLVFCKELWTLVLLLLYFMKHF